jgi:hypothetical protein
MGLGKRTPDGKLGTVLSQTFRFERDKLRRRRLRWKLFRWTIEAAIGVVPNRASLRSPELDHDDPKWDPTFQPETLYAKLRIHSRA